MDTQSVESRVAALVEEIRSRRFRGEYPPVALAEGASLEEVVAAVLAAERLNAPLLASSGEYHPQAGQAGSLLTAARRAMNAWNFREARRRLDEAARAARDPALQQRVTLYLALCALLRDVVRTGPGRSISASHAQNLAQVLPRLDCLSEEERTHYAREVERLCALHRALANDAYLRTLWHLIRARVALDITEEDYGLAWLLAARAAAGEMVSPSEYLDGLMSRARRKVLLLVGEVPADGAEQARAEAAGLRLGEVFDAFVAALDAGTGRHCRREMLQFAVQPFASEDE